MQLKLRDIPTWEEVKKLWNYLVSEYEQDKNEYNLRNIVFYGLLAFCGLRLSEALELTKDRINLDEEIITIEQKKKKAEVFREVVLPKQLKPYVEQYLHSCEDKLFNLSERGARQYIYRLTKRVLGRRIRPHAFRHAFALRILDRTKDIEKVRRLLGHAAYQTVKLYLDFSIRDIREEIQDAVKI